MAERSNDFPAEAVAALWQGNKIEAIKILRQALHIVKDWSESSRYEIGISEAQARDLYSACTARTDGVLNWIKRRW